MKKGTRLGLGDVAFSVEEVGDASDVGLRLLNGRDVQEIQRLAQDMVGAESTDTAGRSCDDGGRLGRSRRSRLSVLSLHQAYALQGHIVYTADTGWWVSVGAA